MPFPMYKLTVFQVSPVSIEMGLVQSLKFVWEEPEAFSINFAKPEVPSLHKVES